MESHHRIVIIGGGNAGISVAAQLRRRGQKDIAIIEPASTHYYQPLWTLVGGGRAKFSESEKPMADVMPQGVVWIKNYATGVDPEGNVVTLANGQNVGYDYLVVAAGIQIDWDGLPGLEEALEAPNVVSNYSPELAPQTWEAIKNLRQGTAVFTMPSTPMKCGGAPQKIAYLAADYWRQQGVLDDINVILVLPGERLFGVKEYSDELENVVERYGIDVRLEKHMTSIDSSAQTLTIEPVKGGEAEEISYDMVHVVPPQSAPEWIRRSPLSDTDGLDGFVSVDKHTLQHTKYDNIFGIGDASSAPAAKTGAAVRKQAPVLVKNLLAKMDDKPLRQSYGGYGSCPLVTSRNSVILAEFDYTGKPTPSFPLINTNKERKDMWILKRYILPAMYWQLILRGLA